MAQRRKQRRGSKQLSIESQGPASLQSQSRPIEEMKKEFLAKLQRQNASTLLSSSLEEDEANQVPDLTILDPELMAMEKVDLLVYIQKLKLEMEQCKAQGTTLQIDADVAKATIENEHEAIVSRLKSDLAAKDLECKNWIGKIEQANELADDLDKEIKTLKENLEYEQNKRRKIEQLFQDLSEKEMELQRALEKRTETEQASTEELRMKMKENIDLIKEQETMIVKLQEEKDNALEQLSHVSDIKEQDLERKNVR